MSTDDRDREVEVFAAGKTGPLPGVAETASSEQRVPDGSAPGFAPPASTPREETPAEEAQGDVPADDTPVPTEAEAEVEATSRPPHVPEAFRDQERGGIRTEALLAALGELQERLQRSLPLPEGPDDTEALARLRRALGWPERPEDYEVEPPHPLIERDAELERRLHAAGFTNDQVKLVYELAAERLLPAVAEVVAESVAARERERLAEHFGGAERFEQVARELRAFGKRHLDPETYAALSSSFAGVLALYRMALAEEPEMFGEAGSGALVASEEQLVEMMRDPRYWRDRDPEFVARVTEGFRRLYGA